LGFEGFFNCFFNCLLPSEAVFAGQVGIDWQVRAREWNSMSNSL
jgi:hypothetical protein